MTWNARLPILWLALTFALLVLTLGILFPDRLHELHTHWTTPDDLDLGYFLLIVFFYFLYQNTSDNVGQPNFYLLPFVCLISCTFFIAQALDLKTLFFVSLALTFPILTSTTLGLKKTKEILIPWSILMMAMPFWYLAIPVLQGITVQVVSKLASLISLTVLVEGNYFTISTGVVHVAGGCSGLKYFMTSITLALISSAMNKREIKFTLASVLIAALLAMLGNWIRVFILLLVAYFQGIHHPLMADHDTLGWIVFACVMLPWFIIDRRLDPANSEALKPAANEDSTKIETEDSKQNKTYIASALALTLSFGVFFITQFAIRPPLVNSEASYQINLPSEINGLKFSSVEAKNWQPAYPEANTSSSGNYSFGKESFDVYVNSYLFGAESEMANKTNTIFDKKQWILVSDKAWQSEQNKAIKIRVALGKSGREYRVVYYWYKHGDTFANTVLSSKLAQLKGLYNSIDSAQLIAISKTCNHQCQQNLLPDNETTATIAELNKLTSITKSP